MSMWRSDFSSHHRIDIEGSNFQVSINFTLITKSIAYVFIKKSTGNSAMKIKIYKNLETLPQIRILRF